MNPSSKPRHPVHAGAESPTLDYAATGDAAGSGTSEAGTQTTGLTPEAGVQRPSARRPRWWADRLTISKCCGSWGAWRHGSRVQGHAERAWSGSSRSRCSTDRLDANATLRARFLNEAWCGAVLAHP